MNLQKRARIYFRLMDIMLVLGVLGLAQYLAEKIGGIVWMEESNPYFLPLAIIAATLNFIMPMFLLMARFMRDEYAQLLWQRTISVLAYFVAFTPFAILVGVTVSRFVMSRNSYVLLYEFWTATEQRYELLMSTWMAYMLLFVAIFQFLRWRDAR